MRTIVTLAALMMAVGALFGHADACTVFVQDDGAHHYYGSNYDWHLGIGYVMVNARGLSKEAWPLPDDPGRPLRWQSKYGSLTFVQYGQGLPKGGMNEAGLAIEGLMLHSTEYPAPDDRPYIGSTAQFKQYLLDTCATVADVVTRLSRMRVSIFPGAPGIHFMVADAKGDCAVIEFLDGRTVVHRGDSLPAKALTNHDYAQSLGPQNAQHNGGVSYTSNSRGRFKTAADRVAAYRSTTPDRAVAYAMDTLAKVSAGNYTKWSVVYDQTARIAYWRCSPDQALRWIDLKKIDFNCRNPVIALPVQRSVSGEANQYLAVFTPEHNRRLISEAFERSKNAINIPNEIWEDVWRWPEKETCVSAHP